MDPQFESSVAYIRDSIRSIQDYPKEGILFRDVTSLCDDRKAFALTIDLLRQRFADQQIDAVVSAEARGFVFGAPLAAALGSAFVMVRKPGKLPRKTIEESYELEYGFEKLQMHVDAIRPGQRVLLLDDLLATGGTMDAMIRMVKRLGGDIAAAAFVIELFDLGGARRLEDTHHVEVFSLVKFPGH